jgi:hypothetical protein
MKWLNIPFLRLFEGSIAASAGAGRVVRTVVVCLVVAASLGVIAFDARMADPRGVDPAKVRDPPTTAPDPPTIATTRRPDRLS